MPTNIHKQKLYLKNKSAIFDCFNISRNLTSSILELDSNLMRTELLDKVWKGLLIATPTCKLLILEGLNLSCKAMPGFERVLHFNKFSINSPLQSRFADQHDEHSKQQVVSDGFKVYYEFDSFSIAQCCTFGNGICPKNGKGQISLTPSLPF